MIWNYFIIFAIVSVICWAIGACFAWKDKANDHSGKRKHLDNAPYIFTIAGLIIFFTFIIWMWISLDRPPLRTMGETRLWYSFLLPLAGLITYSRWKYKWILSFTTVLSLVFILVNLFKPQIHSKTLMPALQSAWFAPHVIVYMCAYAMLGASFVSALYLLIVKRYENKELCGCDELVSVGLGFLTIGMLFGAFWAKQAWGDYWTWDPKETWAAITWFSYLLYLHYRKVSSSRPKTSLVILVVGFVFLQICWWGINYLPAARMMSMHTYK